MNCMFIHCRRAVRCLAFFAFFGLGAVRGEILINEGFSDGGRTDGADALDAAWYTIGAASSALTIVNDTGGINSGNTMQLSPTAAQQGFAAMFPRLVTLKDGESLRMSFTFRFTGTTNLNQSGRLRFGMYNSWGTKATSDANTVWRKNDDGYFASTNPGLNSAGGTSFAREISGSELTMLSGPTGFGTAGASVNLGTNPGQAVFTLTRNGNSMSATCSINGLTASTGTDPHGPVTFSFDQMVVSFGLASQPSPMRIDNIVVEYLGTGGSGSTQILMDGFSDGGRTDGADTADSAWYSMKAAGSVLSVATDSVLGGGNALRLTASSSSQGFVGRLPAAVALADGESLSLIFNWRFTGTSNINKPGRLRFGLYNAMGTYTTSDNSTATRNNDVGYNAQTNPGQAGTSGTTVLREAASDDILIGNGFTQLGSAGASVNGGTSAHVAQLTLTRSGSSLIVFATIDGQPAATGTDASPLTFSFDEVAISIGIGDYTTPSPLVVDDVEVVHAGTGTGVGDGVIGNPVSGPSPAHGIGGTGFVLVKNWDFGTNGTIRNIEEMSQHFQYYDQFNTFNNGWLYGSSIVSPIPANALSGQPVEGTTTGGQSVRQFFSDSLRTYLVPLNGATTVQASSHNVGNGSFHSKWRLERGGSLLNKDIIWETRVRYVTPRYFWFCLWTAGYKWLTPPSGPGSGGAEADIVESFGYDNASIGGGTNFTGNYWHSNTVGGTDQVNFRNWNEGMAAAGITSYDATQYHTWTYLYRKDNTFSIYVDGIEVQRGTHHWTYGSVAGADPLDINFLFDGAWGHTDPNTRVHYAMPASELAGKYYEWDYSRVYLRD